MGGYLEPLKEQLNCTTVKKLRMLGLEDYKKVCSAGKCAKRWLIGGCRDCLEGVDSLTLCLHRIRLV